MICIYPNLLRMYAIAMNQIEIGPGGQFSLDGENFVIEVGAPPKDRPPSTSEAFTILKSEPYLRVYEDLASSFSPRSILELGIFQGGSYVFLDKLFMPLRMSAVEISPQPVASLLQYPLPYRESVCSLWYIAKRRRDVETDYPA